LKSGKGILIWRQADHSISDTYEGEFLDGKFHGKGTFKWQDGRFYSGRSLIGNYILGEWREGKMNGKGLFRWKDGR
jgi:hypothetical protein